MAKVGRPTKYRADFHPEDFLRLSNLGKVLAQIAREWKVERETIRDWAAKHKEFSTAVKRGRQWAEAWWMDLFQGAAVGKMPVGSKFNAVPAIWLTKNAFGWADKVEQEESSTQSVDVTYRTEWGNTSEPGRPVEGDT